MRIGDMYTPQARTVHRDEPLAAAARTLCGEHVGALVVTERNDPRSSPIGILTDRDIVRGQLGRGADLYCLTVGDVMTAGPLVLDAGMEIGEAIEAVNARGVRRAPVVDAARGLVGMVTLDDLLPALARELRAFAELLGHQARQERAAAQAR